MESKMSSQVNQYGFFYDQSRCIGCQDCAIACKSWNMIPSGPSKWARVFQWETGSFPSQRVNTLFAPCYHCANPVCIPAANGAMFKEPKYGAVLIDPTQASSANLKAAWAACPYGAIVFDSDSPTSNASKCTMCIDRLEQNMLPACVMACPMRALDFGQITALQAKYGTLADLPSVPSSTTTSPSVVFKAQDQKTQVVPYDSNAALALLAARPSGLPQVFSQPSDATDLTSAVVTRGSLNMKPTSVEDFMHATADACG